MYEQKRTAKLLVFLLIVLDWLLGLLNGVTLLALGWWAFGILLLVGLLLLGVLGVNAAGEFLKIFRRQPARVGAMFAGLELNVNFFRKLGGILWMSLWLFIWSLPWLIAFVLILAAAIRGRLASVDQYYFLLVVTLPLLIPAVRKGYAYCMTFFILADSPDVKAIEALDISKCITNGHIGKLFVMSLSFWGWSILTALPGNILNLIGDFLAGDGHVMLGAVLTNLGNLLTPILFALFLGPYMFSTFAGYYEELCDLAIAESKATGAGIED
ncbi:MAG: DUF975 family protein [Oscillospiraceae bacterium]|nr:DUF975 family protein [Oscillospiraceae bacterium]